MTTSHGDDGGGPPATPADRHATGARHRGGSWHDSPANRPDRSRFVVVLRGYDRIEVDEYVDAAEQEVARLIGELTRSDDRARRAEQRVEALERENRSVRAKLDAAASAVAPASPEGFGARAERLLRLAEQEAASVRAEAAEEAVVLRQKAREDIERQRHEAEQALISRSAKFDEHASRWTAELERRDRQAVEHLAAARSEAAAVEASARRSAEQLRARAEAEGAEVRVRAEAEVAQLREQATHELDRITGLQGTVRSELQRLSNRLGQEIARTAPAGAAGKPPAVAEAGPDRSETGSELASAGAGEAPR